MGVRGLQRGAKRFVQSYSFKKIMVEQRPEGSKGANHAVILGQRTPGRENSKCKCPDMEACGVCQTDGLRVARASWVRGDWERGGHSNDGLLEPYKRCMDFGFYSSGDGNHEEF